MTVGGLFTLNILEQSTFQFSKWCLQELSKNDALKFADQNAWKTEDLPFALIMVATIGVTFEFASRNTPRWAYSAGVTLGIATALPLIRGNFAVGFAGSENNQINVLFFAGPVIALVGGMAVRSRTSPLYIVLAGCRSTNFGRNYRVLSRILYVPLDRNVRKSLARLILVIFPKFARRDRRSIDTWYGTLFFSVDKAGNQFFRRSYFILNLG